MRKPLPSPEAIAELPPDGGSEFNRLVFEKSPYLLQHARNPVDWRPWGPEAFEAARREGKPVFLSVGYSTCHWCHVMEHESFEDEEVAALLNAAFVCVKVDREERPDVDQVYMTVTQAMTGSGGWPMTVVMTPAREPFFAGTYFPKRGAGGRPGMMDLVPTLAEAWRTQREDVVAHAARISEQIRKAVTADPVAVEPGPLLERAVRELAARFDAAEGGFGDAPKFPVPHNLRLLLRQHRRTGDAQALAMAEKTLDAMARGGIRDHLGGGFHRYSTDRIWLAPHFEKMLYDQALLALAYLDAFEATRNPAWREVAADVFDYVLRDLTSPRGAFFSAEDADSEGVEGLFYLWSREELVEALGAEDAAFAAGAYGVTEAGNFVDVHVGRPEGRSVLSLREGTADEARLRAIRGKLLAVRSKRVRPLLDDKVLTDWNGLMIAALAQGARACAEPRWTAAAARAADFVLAELRTEEGRLLKRWREGHAAHAAVLDDYAFLVWGLVELHQADHDPRWLAAALELNGRMLADFWDPEHGGLFLTAHDGEALMLRPKESYDGAIPSGNAVAASNLLRLAHLTGRTGLAARAEAIFRALGRDLGRAPSQHSQMMLALDLALGPAIEVVIAGEPGAPDTRAMLEALRTRWLPHAVVLLRPPGEEPPIAQLAEFVRAQTSREGRATAYVCRDFACELPTTDPEQVLRSLDAAVATRTKR